MAKVPRFPVQADLQFWPDITVVAATVFLESEGEPELGRVGVAWVISNRMTKWGLTLQQVVFGMDGIPDDKFEPFSCWNQDYRTKALARLIKAGGNADWTWKAAASGFWKLGEDPTLGSTFYLNPELTKKIRPDGKLPGWYDASKVAIRIGQHEFLTLG